MAVEIGKLMTIRHFRIERMTGIHSTVIKAIVAYDLGSFELLLEEPPAVDRSKPDWLEDAAREAILAFAEDLREAALQPLVKRRKSDDQDGTQG